MNARPIALVALVAVVALAACRREVASVGVVAIETPASPGSETPNLASGLDGGLYLSWVEPRDPWNALRFATWHGSAWSAPRTVAVGEGWIVNWADFASLAAGRDALAAHWLVRSGEGYASDVNVAASQDRGMTWGSPVRPHDDGTPTEHGFVTLVPRERGEFGIVWLDGRRMADAPPGPMTLRYAVLRADGTLAEESVLDERVCDCCSTDAVRVADGATLVVYRDRADAELRDISLLRVEDGRGASAPVSVHADGWEMPACPVNGPAIAAQDERGAVAWFTGVGGESRVLVAFTNDAGRTFEDPLRIDGGRPLGRVDVVMLDDGSALASWIEELASGAEIRVRRVRPGVADEPIVVARTSAGRSSGFPRLARLDDRVFLAWTAVGPPSRIRTAEIHQPMP